VNSVNPMSPMSWRGVYHGYDDEALAQLAGAGLVRRAVKIAATEPPSWESCGEKGGAVKVGDVVVRLDAKGPGAARCPCPATGACLHVLVAAMFVRDEAIAAGLEAPADAPSLDPAAEVTTGRKTERGADAATTASLTTAQRDLGEEVRACVAAMLGAGLSHVTPEAADRLGALGVSARATGLPLLSRFIAAAAGLTDGLAAHDDDTPEDAAAAALARVWALTRALDEATPQALPGLVGDVRRSFDVADDLELVPLGAQWWVAESGARGVTLFLWDATSAQFRSVTTSRPAGVDAGFARSADAPYFWGAPLSVLDGPFRLLGPRVAADGSLSPTADRVVRDGGFTEASLRAIVAPDWQGLGYRPPRFGRVSESFHLLEPARRDAMTIDEPAQQLVWPMAGADGVRIELRQPIAGDYDRRIDNLLAIEEKPVQFVLACRGSGGTLRPVAVFLRDPAGPTLVNLDFAALPGKTTGLLARWWQARRRRADAARMTSVPSRSAVRGLCDDARDLCLDVAATGRLRLSPGQVARVTSLAQQASDLALTTLAGALLALDGAADPDALLRVQLIADRLSMLDDAFG